MKFGTRCRFDRNRSISDVYMIGFFKYELKGCQIPLSLELILHGFAVFCAMPCCFSVLTAVCKVGQECKVTRIAISRRLGVLSKFCLSEVSAFEVFETALTRFGCVWWRIGERLGVLPTVVSLSYLQISRPVVMLLVWWRAVACMHRALSWKSMKNTQKVIRKELKQ